MFKAMKPELTTMAIRRFVEKSLGPAFTKVEIVQLKEVYETSRPHTPLLLILTPGNDPMEQIRKLQANNSDYPRTRQDISLGKGQGAAAKALIEECKKNGSWAVLQNCHLSKSFLPELESIIESL